MLHCVKCLLILFFLFFYKVGIGQVKSEFSKALKLIDKDRFIEGEKILNEIEKNKYSELDKSYKIQLFVNYSKINIYKKEYTLALDNLLKAKTLNVFDSVKYQRYYNSTFAELFFELGAYDLSINYLKAYLKSEKDQVNRFYAYNRIGTLQLHLSQTKEALISFTEQFNMSTHFENKVSHFSALNNMALVYLRENNYKKALRMFLVVEQNIKNISSERSFYFVVRGNIGRTYYWLKEYKKSIPYLKDYFEFTSVDKDFLNEFNLQKLYGKALIKSGNINLAKQLYDLVVKNYKDMKVLAKLDFINFNTSLFNALNQKDLVAKSTDELEQVFIDFKRQQKNEHNTASNVVSQYLIAEAKAKIAIKKKESEFLISQKIIAKKERNLMFILIGALFIFIAISVLTYIQQLKNKKVKLALEQQSKILEAESAKIKLEYLARK